MKVAIIAALTADGYIGRDAGHLVDWSSPEDKTHFRTITKELGVIVMGSRTFATIGRALPGRRTLVYTSQPDTIAADGVEPISEDPQALIRRLAHQGAAGVAVCGGASIYTQFLKAGVVDELYLTIEPLLFGHGVRLFNDGLDLQLQLVNNTQLNSNTVLLHYKVLR